MTLDQYFNRRVLGAIFVGIGNFLRVASDRDPEVRRGCYLSLLAPIVPEVVARSPVIPEKREDPVPSTQFSPFPALVAVVALPLVFLIIRPRLSVGRRMKRSLLWRRLSVGFSVAGLVLRQKGFPPSRPQPIWLAAAGPVLAEIVDETLGKRHPRLARRLSALMTAVITATMQWLGRPRLRDDHKG